MGCFDTVHIKCPYCGIDNDIQSKAREYCDMSHFHIQNAPLSILADIEEDSKGNRLSCDNCARTYYVFVQKMVSVLEFVGKYESNEE